MRAGLIAVVMTRSITYSYLYGELTNIETNLFMALSLV